MPDIHRVDHKLVRQLIADPVVRQLLPEIDPGDSAEQSPKLETLHERLANALGGSPPLVFEAIEDLRNAEGTVEAFRNIGAPRPANPTALDAPTALIRSWHRRLDRLDFHIVFEGWAGGPSTGEWVRLAEASAALREAVADMLQLKYRVRPRPQAQANDLLVAVCDVLDEVCVDASPVNRRVAAAWMLHLADIRPLARGRATLVAQGDKPELEALSRVVARTLRRRRSDAPRQSGPAAVEPSTKHARALLDLACAVRQVPDLGARDREGDGTSVPNTPVGAEKSPDSDSD